MVRMYLRTMSPITSPCYNYRFSYTPGTPIVCGGEAAPSNGPVTRGIVIFCCVHPRSSVSGVALRTVGVAAAALMGGISRLVGWVGRGASSSVPSSRVSRLCQMAGYMSMHKAIGLFAPFLPF